MEEKKEKIGYDFYLKPEGEDSSMKKDYAIHLSLGLFFIFLLVLILPFSSSYAMNSPRRNISVEPRWGYFFMDSSKWEDVFGRTYSITGGLKINMELFNQMLQFGVGTGYIREHEANIYIYNIPIEATINFRLKFSPNQFVVPYIGGGLDYSYFKQKSRGKNEEGVIITEVRHNNRKGYHVNAGIQFLLNPLDLQSAKRIDKKFGVNATYLTLEVRYSDLANFDTLEPYETDVSGWCFYMGILFEF